jgi:hypothetical protein
LVANEAGPVGVAEAVISGQMLEPPGDRRFDLEMLGDRADEDPHGMSAPRAVVMVVDARADPVCHD